MMSAVAKRSISNLETVGLPHSRTTSADDAFFSLVYHEAPLGIARVSLDGFFISVNPRLCAMLGYRAEQLIGRSFQDFTHEEDRASSSEVLQRLANFETRRFSFEKRYRHFDGHVLWVNLSVAAVPEPVGLPSFYISIFEDISARKAAEQKLIHREEQYRTVIATSSQGFWMNDMEGRLLEVNDAYCRMLGYSRDELLRMNIHQIDAYDDRKQVAARIAELKKHRYLSFISHHRRKDGSLMPVKAEISYTTILADRVFSFFHDLSESEIAADKLKRLQQASEERRREAEEARRMLVQVSESTLRDVGQELHDDVGQIVTGAALLAGTMAASLAKRQQAEAGTASQLVDFLNEAVDKLRAISHGLYPIELETGGLEAMLISLANSVRSTTSIDARLKQDHRLPELDNRVALQIYRICQEATRNVTRHSGATVMTIVVASRDDQLTVSVVDNGRGIKNNRRRSDGIGLATMKSRALRIGGKLSIVTPRGGGTSIELELPLSGTPA
jgi:PAS domain S-box-containing protein